MLFFFLTSTLLLAACDQSAPPSKVAEKAAPAKSKSIAVNVPPEDSGAGATFVMQKGGKTVETMKSGTHIADMPPQMLDFLVKAEKQAIDRGTLIGERKFHDADGKRLTREQMRERSEKKAEENEE